MTLNSKKIYWFALLLMLMACEESPFVTRKEAEKEIAAINLERNPFHAIENVVAILDNDIYYFHALDEEPVRLTTTPGEEKTNVKLSFDKSRIAYLNGTGTPVIIRADNGEHIETLDEYAYVTQMDWAKDRLTLYILVESEVVFYGPPLAVVQPTKVNPWDRVRSFSMNAIGDQGYFIEYYDDASPNWLNLISENGNINDQFPGWEGDLYDYIDFYDNHGGFMLGLRDYYDDSMEYIICVSEYSYAAYAWDYENMNSPEFNSDQEMLLYGTVEGGGSHLIKAVYLGEKWYEGHGLYDKLTYVLENHPSASPIFIDWVQ